MSLGWLEVLRPGAREVHGLAAGRRLTIGRGRESDVVLRGDAAASRIHAVVEQIGVHWCVRDLASANGTFVNGTRLLGERPLRQGDEIAVGAARIRVHIAADAEDSTQIDVSRTVPSLTPRERDVLLALCRPLLSSDAFTEPASIREVAAEIVVTEGAVKQHLVNLYAKFGIPVDVRRRVSLANEALRRGAVTLADLRDER